MMKMSATGQDADPSAEAGDNNIQVFIRIRPPSADELVSNRVVEVDDASGQLLIRQAQTPKVFNFDYVADIDSTQESIFNHLGKKVIDNCMSGYNGTIFAYGQTGSGKTYTMLGPSDECENFHHDQRGVIPRSFEYLFSLISREKEMHGANKEFLCKCSFLEIYKEQIFDLLDTSNESLQLRESFKTGVYVSGLAERVVIDASEAYEILNNSWTNRRVGETLMNRESSRSHAVFTLTIESKKREGAIESIKTSMLHLVDLAGSERQKDTGASGQRLKEAGSINKSLSNLGNVIMALVSEAREGKKRFVPYRDSKLTFLLRDSLGGNSKTSLIACIHSGQKCLGETVSTLYFAKRAKMIKNKAVKNENAHGNIKALQEEIKRLREEMATYKKGNMPLEAIPAAATNDPNALAYKKMFVQAMLLQQRLAAEKQELQEEIHSFKDICGKKDKVIMQSKMITKFRENAIRLLESKSKDTVDERIANLQEELQILKKQLEQNPEVLKCKTEIKHLKSNLRALKSESGIIAKVEADFSSLQEMEIKFEELTSDKSQNTDGPHKRESLGHSKGATDNKHASQISDLETEMEMLKQQLADKEEDTKKVTTLHSTDIASHKKQIEELEAIISANLSSWKLEKDALHDQHLNTVKFITTPKKCLKLRNRTVVREADTPKTPEEQGNVFNFDEEDQGILSEQTPLDVIEQAKDALAEDLKKQQNINTRLESNLAEKDAEKMKLTVEKEAAEMKLLQFQEFLEKEKSVSHSLREELQKAEKKMREASLNSDTASDEIIDLKTVLASADRELADQKKKVQEIEKSRAEVVEKFEAKMSEVEVLIQGQAKEVETLLNENTVLQIEIETEKEARDILSTIAQESMDTITAKDSKIKDLQQKLLNAEQNILDERDLTASLMNQLKSGEMEKNQELLIQITQNQTLSSEIEVLKSLLDSAEDEKTAAQREKDSVKERATGLEKNLKLSEDKLACLYQQQKNDTNMIANLQQEKEGLQEQIEHIQTSEELANKEISELKQSLEEKNQQNETLAAKKELEIEEIKDCLASLQDDYDDMSKAAQDSQQQVAATQAEEKAAKAEVIRLKELLKAKEEQEDKDLELINLTTQLEHLQNIRKERNHEVALLKEKLQETSTTEMMIKAELENVKIQQEEALACKERLESENQSLKTKLEKSEELRSETAARIYTYMLEEKKLKTQVTTMMLDLDQLKKENKNFQEANERLTDLADKDSLQKRMLQEQLESLNNDIKCIQNLYANHLPTETCNMENVAKFVKLTIEDNKKLADENCALGGHGNHKQKIRHLENLKRDLDTAKTENMILSAENNKLKQQLVDKSDATKPNPQRIATPMKENVQPIELE